MGLEVRVELGGVVCAETYLARLWTPILEVVWLKCVSKVVVKGLERFGGCSLFCAGNLLAALRSGVGVKVDDDDDAMSLLNAEGSRREATTAGIYVLLDSLVGGKDGMVGKVEWRVMRKQERSGWTSY